jgi:hypothetical protein
MLKDIPWFIPFMSNSEELTQRIQASFEDLSEPLWFPALTSTLADIGWTDLKKSGLKGRSYSTTSILLRSYNNNLERVDDLSPMFVEFLPMEIAQDYSRNGIRFFTADEVKHRRIISCVKSAFQTIKLIPSLFATVSALVRSVHLIKSKNDNYDISFSEPHLPFSIFISVPTNDKDIGSLRIAEAIIHEAMHLELSLIERRLNLVCSNRHEYYAPWKREYRTASNVMHGLYVFAVIYCVFRELIDKASFSSSERTFVTERIATINRHKDEIADFMNCPDLTKIGGKLTARLIRDSNFSYTQRI